MLVTLEGVTKPAAQDLAFLKETLPGGVVLPHAFKASMAVSYLGVLHALEKKGSPPLLIGANLYQLTDAVRMVPADFVQLPSMLSLAAINDPAMVKEVGRLMAQYMLLMGFNFHFGPSLELAPTLAGAPDTLNTFGSNPRFTAEAGTMLFEAFRLGTFMPVDFPAAAPTVSARRPY